MKTTLFITALLFSAVNHLSLGQTPSGTATISGIITGSSDSVFKVSIHPDSTDRIVNLKEGNFRDSFEVTPGFYIIEFPREYGTIYLEPGFQLGIAADMTRFDESITFSGKGKTENTFIAGIYRANEIYSKQFSGVDSLTEAIFISKTNSHYDSLSTELKKLSGVSSNFKGLAEQMILLEKINAYNIFPMRMMRQRGKNFQPSESFPDVMKELNTNNTGLLNIPNYSLMIQIKARNIAVKKKTSKDIKDPNLEILNAIDSMVQVPVIKEKVIADLYKMIIDHSTDKAGIYERLLAMSNNEKNESNIKAHYEKWKLMAKGNPSPDFSFNDVNGKSHTLAELKGKIVYIDIWATWCQPCIAEIPSHKKLIADFKGKEIAFVSIAMNDKKDKWQAMLKDKALEGLQLFADNAKVDFFEKYAVNSIPRFIILDREGKIIDPNAKRPSDPELKKYLQSLL